jgi:hypothetical protein
VAQLTLVLLHTPTLEAFVQQPNAQSYVNTHALLIDHARNTILNQDVGTVGAELVATVRNLQMRLVLDPDEVVQF